LSRRRWLARWTLALLAAAALPLSGCESDGSAEAREEEERRRRLRGPGWTTRRSNSPNIWD
jgi:hypothetical protein